MKRPFLRFPGNAFASTNGLASLFFIAVGVAFGTTAVRKLEIGTTLQMGPGYFPLVLSFIVAGLGVIILLLPDGRAPATTRVPWRALVLVGSAPVVFAMLVPNFGLVPAVAGVTAIAASASRRATPRLILLTCVAVTAVSVIVFKLGLGLPLELIDWAWW